jgi:maintenance of morphology protein 1
MSQSFTQETEFDANYTDTLSLSLSTSYLLNYPMPSFARLPVSLTISLSLFKSSVRELFVHILSDLTNEYVFR